MHLGWRSFLELRTLETICIGRRGPMLPKSFYYRMEPHNYPKHELELHQDCTKCLQGVGWNLVAHEWTVKTSAGRNGVGDLVFQKGGIFMVMECKRKAKPKVYDQALFYSQAWSEIHQGKLVLYGIWTCTQQEILGKMRNGAATNSPQ